MVETLDDPIEMDDDWGYPYLGNLHVGIHPPHGGKF